MDVAEGAVGPLGNECRSTREGNDAGIIGDFSREQKVIFLVFFLMFLFLDNYINS